MGSDWDDIAELYTAARKLPAAEHAGFLRVQQVSDGIRAEVLSLLETATPDNDLLERGVSDFLPVEDEGAKAELPRLLVGDLIAKRFRVTHFLGRGGMGEVYAVTDQELGEEVALKLLHPDLATQASFLERFRREIRLMRRISHPNVARVFDFVQDNDQTEGSLCCYVMERLDGETLAARLKRLGPFGIDEALGLARQMGAGLAAAHAAQVVHRDFKPGNVMLTQGGRAVIMDFGLAGETPDTAGAAATTSLLMGTPGYVAPEQWTGKAASTASDIYAFGVVLHEMVTGEHPNHPARLPGEWKRVIDRCLEPDPRQRWTSATAVVEALSKRSMSRRQVAALVGGCGVAVAGVGGVRWRQTAFRKPGMLLVAPVQNLTGDARYGGATELLYSQLNQSALLQLVSPERQRAVLTQMGVGSTRGVTTAKARELAWRSGAMVLHATLSPVGSDLGLALKLEGLDGRPDSVVALGESVFRASGPDDLMNQFRAAAAWVRSEAGEAAAGIAAKNAPPEEITTGNWRALAAYARAREARQQSEFALAEDSLKEALRLDPSFTSASRELADMLIQLHRYQDGFQQWSETVRLLEARQVTSRERFEAESLFFQDVFEFGKGLEASRSWVLHYPKDAKAHFEHGSNLIIFDRFDEATAEMERAWQLEPTIATARWLAVLGWFRGDEDQTRRGLAFLKGFGEPPQYFRILGQTHFLQGAVAEAEGAFRRLSSVSEPLHADSGHGYLTCLMAETGRWGDAMEWSRRNVAMLRRTNNRQTLARRLLQQAYLLARNGEKAEAQMPVEESCRLEDGPRHLIRVATMRRMLGDVNALRAMSLATGSWPKLRIYELAKQWIDLEQQGAEQAGRPRLDALRAVLRGVPVSVIPIRTADPGFVQTGGHPPAMDAKKMWYMADHHWPGMCQVQRG